MLYLFTRSSCSWHLSLCSRASLFATQFPRPRLMQEISAWVIAEQPVTPFDASMLGHDWPKGVCEKLWYIFWPVLYWYRVFLKCWGHLQEQGSAEERTVICTLHTRVLLFTLNSGANHQIACCSCTSNSPLHCNFSFLFLTIILSIN